MERKVVVEVAAKASGANETVSVLFLLGHDLLLVPTFSRHATPCTHPPGNPHIPRSSSASTHSYRTPISRARRPRNEAMHLESMSARFSRPRTTTCHTLARTTATNARTRECTTNVWPLRTRPPPFPAAAAPEARRRRRAARRRPVHRQVHLRDQRQQPVSSCCRHGSGSGRAPGAVRLVPRDRFCAFKARR